LAPDEVKFFALPVLIACNFTQGQITQGGKIAPHEFDRAFILKRNCGYKRPVKRPKLWITISGDYKTSAEGFR
jgi:hypothetical protein